jgi:NAD(P)-dependent dehydrogenase (short-subunit alcohol dehydrogenase family)
MRTANMDAFRDKVAVITGAGGGIGRALAVELARAGARLALSDVNQPGLDETLVCLPGGTDTRGYRVDVARRDAMFAHADDVERDFGATHFVFNNAGVTVLGTIANTSIEEFEWQLAINLWGVIYGTKAFLPMMLARNEGHIVNISSIFGIVTTPCQGAYHVSKFGVRGFTECLARELEGTGVRASCVHPGGIRTEIGHSARKVARFGGREQHVEKLLPSALVTPPGHCARGILAGVARGKRRILVGSSARTLDWVARLFPARYGRVLAALKGF